MASLAQMQKLHELFVHGWEGVDPHAGKAEIDRPIGGPILLEKIQVVDGARVACHIWLMASGEIEPASAMDVIAVAMGEA